MTAALFLFNLTDTMLAPWAAAGVECWSVDMQHPKGEHRDGNVIRVGADIKRWRPPQRNWIFGCGFPPCTDLSVSGARWFRDKGLFALAEAIELFAHGRDILEALGCEWFLENPVSTISTYWRKPDYTFDPCDYAGYEGGAGDTYTKKTCLWTSDGLVMPEKRRLEPTDTRIHTMPPSAERANLRSATPPGFANAMFASNYRVPKQRSIREMQRDIDNRVFGP